MRGRWTDPFGHTAERRAERNFRDEYLVTMEQVCDSLNRANLDAAIAIAALPRDVRGYGPVKEAALKTVSERHVALMQTFNCIPVSLVA